MEMFGEYIKETRGLNLEVIEDKGWVSWIHFPDAKVVYMEDIYVRPDFRRGKLATELVDRVKLKAKELGAEKLRGTINMKFKGTDGSLKAHLAYGFHVWMVGVDMIYLELEI